MKKILIIEDEILIQASIKKFLEKKGATVSTTISGNESIQMIKDENFDRIVCDLMLNDITGFDVIEECKKIIGIEQIRKKFVIMTAYSSPQVIDRAKEYGCTLLNKPFSNINEAINIILGENNEK